jgi:hypothetical protein
MHTPTLLTRCAMASLAAAFTLLAVTPAHATTMVELSQAQMVAASDHIVRGTITETWSEPDARGTIWTRAQVEIDEIYKGQEGMDAIIVDQLGGSWAGTHTRVHGASRFSIGEDVVLFLEDLSSGHTTVVGMFQGKYTVQLDPDSRQSIVRRATVPLDQPYDHRFLPLPSAEDMIMLNDFATELRSTMAMGWDGQPIPGTPTTRLERLNQRARAGQTPAEVK